MSSDVHLRFLLGSCQQLMIDDQLWSSFWDYDIFSLRKKRNLLQNATTFGSNYFVLLFPLIAIHYNCMFWGVNTSLL